MKVRVIDYKNGLKEYNKVTIIRITSRNLNLLIMEDHLPMIGEIQGSVEILDGDDQINFNNVDGYFMHKNNTFEMMIKE